MWGEIEPSSNPGPVFSFEKPVSTGSHVDAQTDLDQTDLGGSRSDMGCSNEAHLKDQMDCSSELSSMIEAVAVSGCPVKSQQLGEPDLTMEERREILMTQYKTKPLVFLERYQTHLKPEHLGAFSHLSTDCRAQHYCKEVQKRASSQINSTRVRNHRYGALRALQREGQYFSEEQMRFREPLLYEQYIGQYLSEEEILQRSQEAMQKGTGGLADLLIDSYQERVLQSRLQEEQDREEGAEEESEDEDGNGESREPAWEPTPEEKAMLREEFVSQMHQRFLDGKDKDFNYSEVDENPDYDNLDIVSHDAEERYFDEDEEEEEADEEEEEEEDEEDEKME
ncbi:coiled-coil domain-containing protein 97 [Chanos chanos]|uniref:Coiled-coil domain-containing protein 97 n=1 Tax=Chanos chanos TaxID=29144 RepID=A0A6J2WRM6_CHACN|nr:coiled-coil domain-containing protein 97 [Chanos chanos]